MKESSFMGVAFCMLSGRMRIAKQGMRKRLHACALQHPHLLHRVVLLLTMALACFLG